MPSIYAQRLSMGPKYNVATSREELGRTVTYRRSKRPRREPKCQTWPRQANRSHLPPQKGDKDIHAFNICPKAVHGAQIQCCNKQRRIGPHRNIQEEQTSSKRAKVPNLAQAGESEPFAPAKRRQGHPCLQYMPKGCPWGPNTMLQQAEKNWAAP